MAPSSTFLSAARGDAAAVSGSDRMIDRPDTAAFTPPIVSGVSVGSEGPKPPC